MDSLMDGIKQLQGQLNSLKAKAEPQELSPQRVDELKKKYEEAEKTYKETQKTPGDSIPKRHAAIEVIRILEKLKILSLIAIGALWGTVLGGTFSMFFAYVLVLGGTVFIVYTLKNSEDYRKYLKNIYGV